MRSKVNRNLLYEIFNVYTSLLKFADVVEDVDLFAHIYANK